MATENEIERWIKSKPFQYWICKYFSHLWIKPPTRSVEDHQKIQITVVVGILCTLSDYFGGTLEHQPIDVIRNVLYSTEGRYSPGSVKILENNLNWIKTHPQAENWQRIHASEELTAIEDRMWNKLY